MIDTDNSVLFGRAGALAILGLIVVFVSPVLLAPFSAYAEKAAMIDREEGLLMQAQARLSLAGALGADAPFVVAADRPEAFRKATGALVSAVPNGSMRLVSFTDAPTKPDSKRIDIAVQAEATPSGLRDFANALAHANPPLVVTGFDIAAEPGNSAPEVVQPTRLNVQLTASTVFVKGAVK